MCRQNTVGLFNCCKNFTRWTLCKPLKTNVGLSTLQTILLRCFTENIGDETITGQKK